LHPTTRNIQVGSALLDHKTVHRLTHPEWAAHIIDIMRSKHASVWDAIADLSPAVQADIALDCILGPVNLGKIVR
jgi:ribosomal protein RSM22 (predicted rRNA methylase)